MTNPSTNKDCACGGKYDLQFHSKKECYTRSPHYPSDTRRADLILSHKFDWVNPDIEKNFTLTDSQGSEYKLFDFERSVSSEDAIREMEKEGYKAANLHDLLLWKDWNDKDWVVALGQTARLYGFLNVPCIRRGGALRGLALDWWDGDWPPFWRLLGVRDGSLKLDTKDSSTLTLRESRVKALLEI